MKIASLLVVMFAVSFAHSQGITISPLNNEFSKKAKGDFSLTNGAFTPIVVTVDPMSIHFVDGKSVVVPLDSNVHVKLSEYSARISAKQTRTFDYQVTCDTYPCALVLFATMMTGHSDSGLSVASRLGHVVYLCDRQKGCRDSVLKQME